MKFPIPPAIQQIQEQGFIEIPFFLIVPLFWFTLLWMLYIFYGRCACGAFYHTEKEKKEFKNFILFSIISSLIIALAIAVAKHALLS